MKSHYLVNMFWYTKESFVKDVGEIWEIPDEGTKPDT